MALRRLRAVVRLMRTVIHGLHGEFGGLEILVLYGVAVWVSLAAGKDAELTAEAQLPTSKKL